MIFALPRSRTAWLSRFLSCGGWHCGHEEIRHLRALEDVAAWFSQPYTGTVETYGAVWWRLLKRYAPNIKVVVIRRPVEEVVESLMQIPGVGFNREALTANMRRLNHKLGQMAKRVPGVVSIDYADMAQERVCAQLFEHCLGLAHDPIRWAALSEVNVQIDFPALLRYVEAYRPALQRLANSARQTMLADLTRRKPVPPTGMSFQCESFDDWLRDGQALFCDHCVVVGEDPDEWRRKNIPLLRTLYRCGAMQIMTARSNGRIFGYLMTLISPSLTSEHVTTGTNALFFSAPDFPGLGLKLQREAILSLKARGVDEVFFEAGKRGSGPRLGAMYRRLGAVDHGQTFRLQLKEA